MNRREIIGAFGTLATLGVMSRPGQSSQRSATGDDVSMTFAHKPQLAHFNAAHLCPMPRSVGSALSGADQQIDADPSQVNEDYFEGERERLRARLKHVLRTADPGEMALVRNTTEANNTIVNGFPFDSGDEIVLWNENHPSNNVAWDVRAKRDRLRVHRVSFSTRNISADEIVEAFAEKINRRTRLLALTHVSNTSGLCLPVGQLCAYARARDIFVHVDGAQAWGVRQLDLSAMGCNSYCGSAHKWLMGPREIGLLFMKSDDVKRMWPSIVGLNWGESWQTAQRGARKFDCFGQRNDAAIAAMHSALDIHEAVGIQTIAEHNRRMVRTIGEYCRELGLDLASPSSQALSGSIVVLEAPVMNRTRLVETLYANFRISASARGGIRLSPHIYNDDNDLDRLFVALGHMASAIREST